MRKNKFDPKLLEQITDLFIYQKMTREETCKMLGIDKERFKYYVYRKLGIKNPKNKRKYASVSILDKISDSKINRVLQLARFGYSDLEIGEDQKLKTDEVRAIIRSKNISKSA